MVAILRTLIATLIKPFDYPRVCGVCLCAYIVRILWRKWMVYKRGALVLNIVEPTEVIIVDDEETCLEAVERLRTKIENYKVIGLDCEWVSNPNEHPIALLQLATSDGFCLLIRLFKFSYMPWNLANLLEDESVIKVGSAVTGDAKRLHDDYNLYVVGCLNIDPAAKALDFDGGSLKRMAESILGIHLNKHWTIQCSNWEQYELSDAQIKYAALDAFVPVKILEKIIQWNLNKVNLREREAQKQFLFHWWFLITNCYSVDRAANRKFTAGNKPAAAMAISNKGILYENCQLQDPLRNVKYKPAAEKAASIKGILYENCQLQDPLGNVLCVCNNKKLDWYLERNLGIEVSQYPRIVRLTFQPKASPTNLDSFYYTVEKRNRCVVCGTSNLLRRKYVVPCEYRSRFPKKMKNYKSHDIVLLCSFCHRESVLRDQVLRKKLAVKCSAPIEQIKLTKEARAINKLKYTASALLKKDLTLSAARIDELKEIIRTQENCDDVTHELLLDIMSRRVPSNMINESHGEKVVKHYRSLNKLDELEVEWRRHFVDTMKPQFLPDLWSVYHNPWV